MFRWKQCYPGEKLHLPGFFTQVRAPDEILADVTGVEMLCGVARTLVRSGVCSVDPKAAFLAAILDRW